jgi:voltage-gated potassium channel
VFSLFAIGAVIAFGTVGFQFIEGWNFGDSLYMTVITMSTVGFEEVHPLSNAGQYFSVVLIILGVGVGMVVLTNLAQRIIERQIRWIFERKKMQKQVDKLEKHIIFCGYGRLGRMAADQLHEFKKKLVIVDHDEMHTKLAEEAGFLVVKGDATFDETLLLAGIQRATHLVSLLPKDSDNLYVILTSRELSPDLFILSRAEDDVGEKRLLRAGANRIMSPYRVSGQKIADGLLRPYVTDFLELATAGGKGELQIEEIRIPDGCPVDGCTLQEASIRQKTNIIVAAIISRDGEMQFNPSGDTLMQSGATLIGLGFKSDFRVLEELLVAKTAHT